MTNEQEHEFQQPEMNPPETEVSTSAQKNEDKHLIVWLSIACGLCVGIIGVLAYWLSILK